MNNDVISSPSIGRSAAFFREANAELEALGDNAAAVIDWVYTRFAGQRIALTSAFGPEGCALIDLVRARDSEVPIYTIDTGFLFEAAIDVRREYQRRGAKIRVIEPLISISRQRAVHGANLYLHDPDRCCAMRKVEPMARILDQLDVWITGIRRGQSKARSATPMISTVARSDGSQVIKLAPLAHWTREQTWDHLNARDLPYNRLLDYGYPSVGCWPCTGKPERDGDERSGRWGGHAKTECGIHTM